MRNWRIKYLGKRDRTLAKDTKVTLPIEWRHTLKTLLQTYYIYSAARIHWELSITSIKNVWMFLLPFNEGNSWIFFFYLSTVFAANLFRHDWAKSFFFWLTPASEVQRGRFLNQRIVSLPISSTVHHNEKAAIGYRSLCLWRFVVQGSLDPKNSVL